MSVYAIIREAGPAWADGKGAFDQPGVNDHAAYMDRLAKEGFLKCAGPLAGSEQGRVRILLIADAASESDVRQRFAADPWAVAHRLVITSIEPWNLLVGAERLARA